MNIFELERCANGSLHDLFRRVATLDHLLFRRKLQGVYVSLRLRFNWIGDGMGQ
jgi:hypothetical protein